jgi:hypothetical protein
MLEEMKAARKVVIKEIMLKVVSDKIDANEGIRQINLLDEESKTAFEVVMKYEQLCYTLTQNTNLKVF